MPLPAAATTISAGVSQRNNMRAPICAAQDANGNRDVQQANCRKDEQQGKCAFLSEIGGEKKVER